ncbi:hypothetical protein PHABIO_342 [Pseudomonas phage Phabio]|uniref:Uncharacterized protein n=1 Tax=Pseudomonas phage Phabio TaxID=2006668 RepID=A0A1Y0SYY0_9CAUD|nr:head maturation protease [Pseudomonas phage Phabio]ARV76973.1 hypothetical protein PHABIO_342 [Pseudomonas phage Phabio]
MQIVVNLLIKPEGYRESLREYIASEAYKKSPFLEWENPKIPSGVVAEEVFNRIFQIDANRICAKIIHIEIEDLVARFIITPHGPLASLIDPFKKYAVATRMLKDGAIVKQIPGFDLIPVENHIEHVGE